MRSLAGGFLRKYLLDAKGYHAESIGSVYNLFSLRTVNPIDFLIIKEVRRRQSSTTK